MSTVTSNSNNEKKQDLLLDALSCIDEDILARGLALRDGKAASGSTAPSRAYLFDLSELDRKPPRRNPWRAILVAAAIIALLAVVPLSAWMVASRKDKGPEVSEPTNGGALETVSDGYNDANDAIVSPEVDAPIKDPAEGEGNAEGIMPGEPEQTAERETLGDGITTYWPETEGEPEGIYPDTPSDLLWTTLDHTNGLYGFRATSYAGRELELIGTVQGKASEQDLSPEDELMLKLIGQWMLSVYTLDYNIHFPLFPDEVIEERILPSFEKAELTYEEALKKISRTANETYGIESLNLSLTLVYNEELTGSNREEFLRQFSEYHPEFEKIDQITSVRKVQISEDMQVLPDGALWLDPMDVPTGFYCYEYKGRWYLDDQGILEDDLCMDLLGADPQSSPFYKSHTWTGEVISVDEYALYLKEELFLLVRGSELPEDIKIGDTVTVTYHGLGVTFLKEESNGLIQTPDKTVSLYILDSITITDP